MAQTLDDGQRKAIHDLSLDARDLLVREAQDLLEGVYGLHADGRLEPAEKLPRLQTDPEARETHGRLSRFLEDEERAGLPRPEAAEKLVKEVAFTHLNRLVAFKMMEARKLIRGTIDKGTASNAFRFYLADRDHAADLALATAGDTGIAYRRFLLWQCGQVAQEVRVLFDPDSLPSRLFPRPRALHDLLALLNAPDLAAAWLADETIGWVYQFFNEREKAQVFERLYKQKQKLRRQDIPAATQLFTPNWIVRYLVQNTLGRLWVQMHPDTRLKGTELLDYLVPLEGEVPPAPLQPVRDITLLDPACGAMHFGLVAFDLFAAMYREELDRAGQPGWPAKPSVAGPDDIPAAIIAHNLFGIDIDLRAVQLSALSLYLKAKSLNKAARITESHLACADVLPLNPARLGTFLREARFTRPVYERLMRRLADRLREASQAGSLLRLERDLADLVAEERAAFARAPLFAGVDGQFESAAAEDEFWGILEAQIIQGLDEFARRQAKAGVDQTFFTGEAVKGMRLAELMLRRYDVVVTNPPYSGKRNLNEDLARLLDQDYPDAKGDLYAAFIQRCGEWLGDGGRLGMITQQSFMFLSSYQRLRAALRARFAIETLAHLGPRAFAEISGEKVNTAAFAFRTEADAIRRDGSVGTYFRLVDFPSGACKQQAMEQELKNRTNTYRLAQRRFGAIPSSPWVYWVGETFRTLFEKLSTLGDAAAPRQGLATADNFRFLRYWWEQTQPSIVFRCRDRAEAASTDHTWFPCMKGGTPLRWYGGQEYLVNWRNDGAELQSFYGPGGRLASRPQNTEYYFREGVTWSLIGSGEPGFRWMPPGWIISHKGPGIFFDQASDLQRAMAVLNSKTAVALLSMVSPSIGFEIGHLASLPWPASRGSPSLTEAGECVRLSRTQAAQVEATFEFISPPGWVTGLADQAAAAARLAALEGKINDEVYRLYGINDEDRAAIEAELSGGLAASDESEASAEEGPEEDQEAAAPGAMTRQELAVRWITYALGVVLGRFQPGLPATSDPHGAGPLGRAVFRREDFAIGSLPAPDEAEFDLLVGPPERFAYVDAEGGRHVFAAAAEAALRALAVPDGIAVLDAGHPRDLPALAERAMVLMLGEEAAGEVVAEGAGGDLRRFLERDYFTRWHLRWYRKRPVYWPLQSAKRGYGFVVFHEKVDRQFLYILQLDYLDIKRNALRLHIDDLKALTLGQAGAARRETERRIAAAADLLAEVEDFAKAMERIVRGGYEPAENWIDDGVLIRLAPLWELIPNWKAEPKKCWERLQAGELDWSHLAMRYWPERVQQKCKGDKSLAIAHGLV